LWLVLVVSHVDLPLPVVLVVVIVFGVLSLMALSLLLCCVVGYCCRGC